MRFPIGVPGPVCARKVFCSRVDMTCPLLRAYVSAFRETTAGHVTSAQYPHRLAIKKTVDVVHRVSEIAAIILLGDIAEMRRDHDIVHFAVRMIERQRLDIE